MLRLLCKNGYLIASGIGRGTHYKLNKDYTLTHAKVIVNATPDAPVNATPDAPVNATPDAPVNATPDAPVNATPDAPVNATPDAPVQPHSARDKNLIIDELIIFCRAWRKATDMARHVGKTPKYIVRHLIPEMIERGLLIREYPDNPHHPAQRYRTKPRSG